MILFVLFLTEVPSGVLADRVGRKQTLLLALILQVLAEIGFIFPHTYWHFVAVMVVAGMNWAFASGCVEALIYDTLQAANREGEMSKTSGLIQAVAEFAGVLGAVLGGLVVSELELGRFIFAIELTAGSVTIGLLLTFTLKEPPVRRSGPEAGSLEILKAGVGLLRSHTALRRLALLAILAAPLLNPLLSIYQPYFVLAGITPFWLGIARGGGSVVGMVSSRYAYRVDTLLGAKRGLLVVTLGPGVLYLLMTVVYHPVFSAVLFWMAYGWARLNEPLFQQYLNRHIESKNRATVLSLISMVGGIHQALIGLAVGWVADIQFGYGFLLMGWLVVGFSLILRVDEQHVSG